LRILRQGRFKEMLSENSSKEELPKARIKEGGIILKTNGKYQLTRSYQ
jgi:hypothetical protein